MLHDLRSRVVAHRYQMELVEPLWPKFGRLWVAEAQRLRDRLGAFQDLSVMQGFTAPHQPLAPWRARLTPVIAARQAVHAKAAQRIAGRLFAERPRAFRKRMEALWKSGKALSSPSSPRTLLDHRIPVAVRALPEQPRVRIPRACAIERPAPIRPERQQDPQRPPERTGQVRDRGIDRDDEIGEREHRRRIGEIRKLVAKVRECRVAECLAVGLAQIALDADEAHVRRRQQRREA